MIQTLFSDSIKGLRSQDDVTHKICDIIKGLINETWVINLHKNTSEPVDQTKCEQGLSCSCDRRGCQNVAISCSHGYG